MATPVYFFLFFLFVYFNWRVITLQYCGGFLPSINMNQPRVHMCPHILKLPSSSPHPCRLSQSTLIIELPASPHQIFCCHHPLLVSLCSARVKTGSDVEWLDSGDVWGLLPGCQEAGDKAPFLAVSVPPRPHALSHSVSFYNLLVYPVLFRCIWEYNYCLDLQMDSDQELQGSCQRNKRQHIWFP